MFEPGDRIEVIANRPRRGFVLCVQNFAVGSDCLMMLVRFDGWAYNSAVPADRARYEVLPDEPMRP